MIEQYLAAETGLRRLRAKPTRRGVGMFRLEGSTGIADEPRPRRANVQTADFAGQTAKLYLPAGAFALDDFQDVDIVIGSGSEIDHIGMRELLNTVYVQGFIVIDDLLASDVSSNVTVGSVGLDVDVQGGLYAPMLGVDFDELTLPIADIASDTFMVQGALYCDAPQAPVSLRQKNQELERKEYFATLNAVERHLGQLLEAAPFPQRWEEEGVERPTMEAKESATKICLHILEEFQEIPSRLANLSDGGVFIRFWDSNSKTSISIEVYNTSEVVGLVNRDKKILETLIIDSPADIARLFSLWPARSHHTSR